MPVTEAGADPGALLEFDGAAAEPVSHAAHVRASMAATGTLNAAILTRITWSALDFAALVRRPRVTTQG